MILEIVSNKSYSSLSPLKAMTSVLEIAFKKSYSMFWPKDTRYCLEGVLFQPYAKRQSDGVLQRNYPHQPTGGDCLIASLTIIGQQNAVNITCKCNKHLNIDD